MLVRHNDPLKTLKNLSFRGYDDFQRDVVTEAYKRVLQRSEQDTQVQAIIGRARHDKRFFAEHFLSDHVSIAWGQHHTEWFARNGERGKLDAIAAPRGSAKTTFFCLIEILHDICYQNESFIVIISESKTLATERVMDVKSEIDGNDTLRSAFRLHHGDTWKQDEIVVNGVRVLAKGRGGQIRGTKFGSQRPSKIILDDVESSETAVSPLQRDKVKSWFFTDVRRAGAPTGETNFLVVGTYLHQDALLPHLVDNPAFHSRKYKAVKSWATRQDLWDEWKQIYTDLTNPLREYKADSFYKANEAAMLEGVEMLWSDGISYLTVQKAIISDGLYSVMKEYQNEPYDPTQQVFDMEKAIRFDVVEDGLERSDGRIVRWQDIAGASIFLDWAGGWDNLNNCYACAVVILWESIPHAADRYGYLVDCWLGRVGISKQVENCFDLHDKWSTFTTRFAVEDIPSDRIKGESEGAVHEAVRRTFTETKIQRQAEGKSSDMVLEFLPRSGGGRKMDRIASLEPKIANGWLAFNNTLTHEFMDQFIQYPTHEFMDAPDATEGAWQIRHGVEKARRRKPRTLTTKTVPYQVKL